jgi:tetratricopeptide (TPR) repeat protein
MQTQYISRFTPRSMSPEVLEAIFVQRKRYELAERLIELICESALTKNKHYRLLVGNRGIGKTHLISLIYHRLIKIEEVQKHLLIAWLPEEAHQIDSFLGFLMAVFEALKEEYPKEYEAKLQEKMERLYQLSFEEREEQEHQAKELLRGFVGQKTLLLLIENLNTIFEGLEEKGQHQLRAYLYNYKFCTILATSQSLFKEIKFKEYPFYRFFRSHHLEDLSSDEAVDLLANIARLSEDKDLETFLQSLTGKERVKAVHHLAGGNPRIYIVFSGFLSQESLDELVPTFMKMLDELTPYYQDRMKSLTTRQRKIVNFLCDRRYACLLGDISQRCFLDLKSAKEELRALQEKGYLRMEEVGREQFYELREPLLRFCLEVKRQRNKPIRLFIDFLRLWYSQEELEERVNIHCKRIKQEQQKEIFLEQEYFLQALQEQEQEQEDPRIISCQEQYDIDYTQEDFSSALKCISKLVELRGNAHDFASQGLCFYQLKQNERALISYDKAIEIDPDNDLVWNLRGVALRGLKEYELALISYKKAIEIDPDNFSHWIARGDISKKLKQYKDALFSYGKALEINSESLRSWNNKAEILLTIKQYKKSLFSCNEALKIKSNSILALIIQGNALEGLKRYEEALDSYEKAINIDPNRLEALLSKGTTLLALKRYEDALFIFDTVIRIDPDYNFYWAVKGKILFYLKRYKEALIAYDELIKINPESFHVFFKRAAILLYLNCWQESMKSLELAFEHIENLETIYHQDIAEIIIALFKNYQDENIEENQINTLVKIHKKHQALNVLIYGLVFTVFTLIVPIPIVNQTKVQSWLAIWQKVVGKEPEFEFPLRLLAKAIEYKEKNGDPRVLLTLPIEEREILKQLLEETSSDYKGR